MRRRRHEQRPDRPSKDNPETSGEQCDPKREFNSGGDWRDLSTDGFHDDSAIGRLRAERTMRS
jgi:hypothetical protein